MKRYINRRKARVRYNEHKHSAAQRGIPFLLTFEQWFRMWEASGRWYRRGRGIDQFCMSRYGDKGAYEAGNVRVITADENLAEHNHNPETSTKFMQRRVDPAFRAKQSVAVSEANRRQWQDPEYRAKQSAALSERNRRRWKDPEYRADMTKKNSASVRKLWSDPDYRTRMVIAASNRRAKTTLDRRPS